eukprot:2588905-Prymnesium_polylepis.1
MIGHVERDREEEVLNRRSAEAAHVFIHPVHHVVAVLDSVYGRHTGLQRRGLKTLHAVDARGGGRLVLGPVEVIIEQIRRDGR